MSKVSIQLIPHPGYEDRSSLYIKNQYIGSFTQGELAALTYFLWNAGFLSWMVDY